MKPLHFCQKLPALLLLSQLIAATAYAAPPSSCHPSANSFGCTLPEKTPNTPSETKQLAISYESALTAQGYNPIQAAGIIANLLYASGSSPDQSLNAAWTDSGIAVSSGSPTAIGIAQWSGTDLSNFTQFATAQNLPRESQQANYAFLIQQLNQSQQSQPANKNAAPNQTLLQAVCANRNVLDIPIDQDQDKRINAANRLISWNIVDAQPITELSCPPPPTASQWCTPAQINAPAQTIVGGPGTIFYCRETGHVYQIDANGQSAHLADPSCNGIKTEISNYQSITLIEASNSTNNGTPVNSGAGSSPPGTSSRVGSGTSGGSTNSGSAGTNGMSWSYAALAACPNVDPARMAAQPNGLNNSDDANYFEKAWFCLLQHDSFHFTANQAFGILLGMLQETPGLSSGDQQNGGSDGFSAIPAEVNCVVNEGHSEADCYNPNNAGYGVAQWGEERQLSLWQYAQNQSLPVSSEAANYGYLAGELRNAYSNVANSIQQQTSSYDACRVWTDNYEMPSGEKSDRCANQDNADTLSSNLGFTSD